MSHTALVKFAPVLTAERWGDPTWTSPGRTFYWGRSLKLIPGTATPLLVDHNMDCRIGVVHELFQMAWTDLRSCRDHRSTRLAEDLRDEGVVRSLGRSLDRARRRLGTRDQRAREGDQPALTRRRTQ